MLRTGVFRSLQRYFIVRCTEVIKLTSADAFPVVGGICTVEGTSARPNSAVE